jgi:hypothetical protein
MTFEKARKKFVDALMGHVVDGPDGSKDTDWEVNFPSKKVLDFLSTVNDPMDTQAILLLRDELPEDEYPNPNSGPLTWSHSVGLIRKYESDVQELAEMCRHESGIKKPSTGKKEHGKRARQRRTQKKHPVVVPTEPMTEHQRQFIALVEKIKAMNSQERFDAIYNLRNTEER